jgi:Tfp pilus assembly protein PilF
VQGRHDDAIAYLEKALETDPRFYLAHWWLGVIYLQRSMLMKAFAQFRQAGALSKRDWSEAAKFTYGHALVGKRRKARAMLEDLTRISGKQYLSPVMIAAIHVTLGETDAAFEWLQKAYVSRDPWLVWLNVDRRFDGVRHDVRFSSLLKKMGLANGNPPAGSINS